MEVGCPRISKNDPQSCTNPTNLNPTSNPSKNVSKKHKHYTPFLVGLWRVGLKVGFTPAKIRNKNEHPASPTPPRPSSTSILHGLIVKLFLLCHCTTVAPLPPPIGLASHQPSLSSASAAAHILCLCRRIFVDCC